MDHSHDQYYTPDEEFQIARHVWDTDGDAPHAAHHLAAALVGDPHQPDRLALLDELIANTRDPLSIAPLGENNYLGTVAVRAYVLAKTGCLPEAVGLIGQVHHANPAVPFLDWAVGWAAADPVAARQIPPATLYSFFAPLISKYPGNVVEVPAARAELAAGLRLFEAVVPDPPPEFMLDYIRVALVRKLGRLDEAEALAKAAYARVPNYNTATAVGMVVQARNGFDEWLVWQQRALDHDPTDTAVRRDLGDWLLDQGRLAEAAKHYGDAFKLEPHDGWSEASLYFANHQQGLGDEWLARLQAFAAAHPESDRARALLGAGVPYLTRLPPPTEAMVNVLPGLIAEARAEPGKVPQGELKMSVSSMEAPSARLAVLTQLQALGGDCTLTVSYGQVQTPDPRRPRAAVTHQVWRYREQRKLTGKTLTTDPLPAVPEPPPGVAAAVGRLAYRVYDRPAWWTLAGEMKPDGFAVDALLGVMAYPPDMPAGWYAPDWVLRCQIAAALLLAHRADGRAVLFDLLRGVYDWTVTAAAVALTAAAEREPSQTAEVLPAFLELLESPPRPGYVCYEYPLVCLIQQLPGVPADVREQFAGYQQELETRDEEEPTEGE